MSDDNTPRFPEINGKEWIESRIGDHNFERDASGNNRNGNIEGFLGAGKTFVFLTYGQVPNLNSPARRTRRGDGSTLVRHRTMMTVISNVKVEIPSRTQFLIYAPYDSPRGRSIVSFFMDDAIINVLGGGIVKRRDLATGRYDKL